MIAPTTNPKRLGRDHLLGGEDLVTFTARGGTRDQLVRVNGAWTHPAFRRPIRHLRDAIHALRDRGLLRGTPR